MASERKAVIKNADMSEDMQQDAVDCASQALEKFNIEKDIAAFIKKVCVRAQGAGCLLPSRWRGTVQRLAGRKPNFGIVPPPAPLPPLFPAACRLLVASSVSPLGFSLSLALTRPCRLCWVLDWQEFDKKYTPTWHCIVGRNFGSYVTHETKHCTCVRAR
jgi:hypothetical protein